MNVKFIPSAGDFILRRHQSAIQSIRRLSQVGILVGNIVWRSACKYYLALLSGTDHLMRMEIREIAASISKEGTHDEQDQCRSRGYSGGIRATDFLPPAARPEEFTPSTIIINGGQDGGQAVWNLEVPTFVRKRLIDMTLKVETVRTHGMLHTKPYDLELEEGNFRRRAKIFVNGQLVDSISLVKPHPHGEDYGVDTRRPFPIYRFIDRRKGTQSIRVEVDACVLWDIDRVALEPILLRKVIKPGVALVLGAMIGTIFSALVTFLLT